jgi:hypothetical protein
MEGLRMIRHWSQLPAACLLLGTVFVASAQQATITLTPDNACYPLSGTVTVTIDLSGVSGVDEVIGGQFRLWYDTTKLTFISAAPAGTTFTEELYESVNGAEIDYMVGVPTDPPGPAP